MTASLCARWLLGVALTAWAIGLVVGGAQLHAWQREMARVLAQEQAGALVLGGSRDARLTVQPLWHRQRALDLLAAVERLNEAGTWRWVMPGSWAVFDDLEARARARIGRAFREGVVQSLRRELERQASVASGIPLQPGTGVLDLQAGCRPAPSPRSDTGLGVEALPAFGAARELVAEAARLDLAVTALRALRHQPAQAQDLRLLTRSVLGAELSGPASRSLAWFEATDDPLDPGFEAMAQRLQWAMRCSTLASLRELHLRLVQDNRLLALEEAASRSLHAGLLAGDGEAPLRRTREALARLDALGLDLATQSHAWMHGDTPVFGAVHHTLVENIARIGLLGPDLADAVRHDARLRHAELHRRLAAGPDTVEWDAQARRYALAPARVALREGMQALVQAPLMREPADGQGLPAPWGLLALVEQGRQCEQEVMPRLPGSLRPAFAGFIERRVRSLALARARHELGGVEPPERAGWLARAQADLASSGASALGTWIAERLAQESLSRQADPEGLPPPADSADEGATPASAGD